jgi:hypothetical protein
LPSRTLRERQLNRREVLGLSPTAGDANGPYFTVTVTLAVTLAANLLTATKVYTVVFFGLTGQLLTTDATGVDVPSPVSIKVTCSAPPITQLSIEVAPAEISGGFASNVRIDGGPCTITVTIASALTHSPAELQALRVYVVVTIGHTCNADWPVTFFTSPVAPFVNDTLCALLTCQFS